jgi:hypothetical protein
MKHEGFVQTTLVFCLRTMGEPHRHIIMILQNKEYENRMYNDLAYIGKEYQAIRCSSGGFSN